jgi:hypothetical protein
MMKRLMVVALACIAAAVLVPLSSASAAEKFAGKCVIHGTAKFKGHLTNELTPGIEYNFGSEAGGALKVGGKGAECESETGEKLTGEAKVKGEGELSCGIGKSEAAGKGTLTLGTKEFKFELSFTAAVGIVALTVKPEGEEGEAKGLATFVASQEELAAKCAIPGGVGKLEFDATAKGEI